MNGNLTIVGAIRELAESETRCRRELLGMAVGYTKVVNGYVVTRWTADRWEVGTWGRKTQTLTDAATEVA